MFKGIDNIFNKLRNKNNPLSNNKHKLQTILQAKTLLADKHRQKLIRHFPDQLNLSANVYASHCYELINNFTEFTQLLPETRNNYYAGPGGFIDHALERTAAALSLCRDYFLADEAEHASLSEPQTQWVYAVFTAALLQGIGKIIIDLNVEIYDQNQQFLENWWPFSGTMITQGTHYTYNFITTDRADLPLKKQITPLLARQLMPLAGFKQITSNKEIFALWLALLIEDDDMDGDGMIFRKILVRADQKAIREWQKSLMTGIRYFNPTTIESTDDTQQLAQQLEQEFYRWLQKALDPKNKDKAQASIINATGTESLIINISGLGVVVTTGLFRQFMMQQSQFNTFGEKYLSSMADEFLSPQDIYSASGEKTTAYALKQQAKALPNQVRVLNNNGAVETITTNKLSQYTSREYSTVPSKALNPHV